VTPREGDPDRREDADVEIGAAVKAKKLRFKRKPQVEVTTHAHSELDPQLAEQIDQIGGEGDSHTERENLPDEVEPGVTYRDVRVRWRAAGRIVESDEQNSTED
jgi:hypothetical protein